MVDLATIARSVGNLTVQRTLQRALRDAVIGLRLERSNLSLERDRLEKLLAPVELESFQVAAAGQAKKKGFDEAYFGTFAFVMILYVALLLYGVAVMRGILEEKSSRIMEVLLGSLSPDQLMTGKILGIGLVGLTQMAIYAATAGLARIYIAASPMAGDWSGAVDAVSPVKMLYFLVYFILGYFLYTSLFAAVGAVCTGVPPRKFAFTRSSAKFSPSDISTITFRTSGSLKGRGRFCVDAGICPAATNSR